MAMTVAVAGSRDFPDPALIEDVLRRFPVGTTFVVGGARGANRIAAEVARERGLGCRVILADWRRYGRGAGFRRNEQIVAAADALLVFWDGVSRGSANEIQVARRQGKPALVLVLPSAGCDVRPLLEGLQWSTGRSTGAAIEAASCT